jgi:hypothetical protein
MRTTIDVSGTGTNGETAVFQRVRRTIEFAGSAAP